MPQLVPFYVVVKTTDIFYNIDVQYINVFVIFALFILAILLMTEPASSSKIIIKPLLLNDLDLKKKKVPSVIDIMYAEVDSRTALRCEQGHRIVARDLYSSGVYILFDLNDRTGTTIAGLNTRTYMNLYTANVGGIPTVCQVFKIPTITDNQLSTRISPTWWTLHENKIKMTGMDPLVRNISGTSKISKSDLHVTDL